MENSVTMSQSRTIQTKLVLPPDTNHLDTIFGGKVLSYIDEIAAITAMKHANQIVVTASIDSVDFLSSARVGDVLELDAVVSSTGRTSMEIFVRVRSKNLMTRKERITTQSFLTMVAVDEKGRPVEVPAVIGETEEERRLINGASARKEHRKLRAPMPG
ncbi:acyl-CoA thioesterase [Jeotgalibacillus proteolyticus]|uniref:Acyl-CoA thioesterase n=1 Tax=Jeotgalibacillus proteolyticus TaxID=2082395 RepID=A0A2S5GDG8_9BACL|nr:acyl-CoA thioesterase [Jeotgalibacillus proteolyticus]PPA71082.1 acyl-CoA thioesterase [Jeotgalibacillus proteolyticus]